VYPSPEVPMDALFLAAIVLVFLLILAIARGLEKL
jgi:hypothetical protein